MLLALEPVADTAAESSGGPATTTQTCPGKASSTAGCLLQYYPAAPFRKKPMNPIYFGAMPHFLA